MEQEQNPLIKLLEEDHKTLPERIRTLLEANEKPNYLQHTLVVLIDYMAFSGVFHHANALQEILSHMEKSYNLESLR